MTSFLSPSVLLGASAELAAATVICCKRIQRDPQVQRVMAAVHGVFFAGGATMLTMGYTLRWLFSSSQGFYPPHIESIEKLADHVISAGDACLPAAVISYFLLPAKKSI